MDLRGDGTNCVKFVVHLEGIEKPMVLNSTNLNELVEKLGRNPRDWIGALIGLYVDPKSSTPGSALLVCGCACSARRCRPRRRDVGAAAARRLRYRRYE